MLSNLGSTAHVHGFYNPDVPLLYFSIFSFGNSLFLKYIYM